MFSVWIEVQLSPSEPGGLAKSICKRISVPCLLPVGATFWTADSDLVSADPMTVEGVQYWEDRSAFVIELKPDAPLRVCDWAEAFASLGWIEGMATDHLDAVSQA